MSSGRWRNDAFFHSIHQRVKSLFAARTGSHHWHPQCRRKSRQIHPYPAFSGFVHQIDAHHNICGNFQRLQNQIQVAFQASGITDHHYRVWHPTILPEADKIPRDLLFCRMRHERIGTGNINQQVFPAVMCTAPLRTADRFTRPVAGMLIHTGQGIEYRAFTHVWIAGQGNHFTIRFHQAQR